jgi:hypothetical protein
MIAAEQVHSPGEALARALGEVRASVPVQRAAGRRWRDFLHAEACGFGFLIERVTGVKTPGLLQAARAIVAACIERERKGLLERPV